MLSCRIRCCLPLLVGGLLLISTSVATAATFCVEDPACPATGTAEPTIAAALDAANAAPGRDRIQIGPGTYNEPGLVDPPGSPVDLVGGGMGATSIGAPGARNASTLDVQDPDSTVSDMTVLLPDGTQPNMAGLVLAGTARRVSVSAPPGSTGTGVELRPGGMFSQGTVALPTGGPSTGVTGYNGLNAGTVEDSTITAQIAVEDVVAVQRDRIVATYGVSDNSSITTHTTIDDVLIQLVPDAIGGSGIDAWTTDGSLSPGPTTLTARHVTILGNGAADAIGVDVYASGRWSDFPATVDVVLSGVILRGFKTDLARGAIGGAAGPASFTGIGTANLSIDYSDYDPTKRSDTNYAGGAGAITDGPHNLNVDPLFSNPSTGDYSLQAGSPLIDQGAPPPLAPDESTTDLAGNPRVVDGNTDMGAFEYQPPSPPPPPPPPPALTLTGLRLSPDRFAVAPRARAHASASRRRTRRVPHGTTIYFKLSRAAFVTLTIVHPGAGRRSGTRCIASSHRLRLARRCDLKLYDFTRHSNAGENAIPFNGRIGHGGRAALAPGHYLLFATPLTGTIRHARFTVVKR